MNSQTLLLTGVTGYIGGQLLQYLERDAYGLRCLVRDPKQLEGKIDPRTVLIQGDVFDQNSLIWAMEGVDVAYYLIHSMDSSADFVSQDRVAAINFARAAEKSKIKRIIYLGGLGDARTSLSSHLQSRQEVGRLLREYARGVQVIEFRASIIIGNGSISFELIRALCERLPIMITPKWVWTLAQPISIHDILRYLKQAITIKVSGNPIFEIGGKDQISYGGIMLEYMRQRQLKRWMLPVPFLTPWLSSLWLGLITPFQARVGRKLIDSALFPTIVNDPKASEIFDVQPLGIQEAIQSALNEENCAKQEYLSSHFSEKSHRQYGNRIIDLQVIEVKVTPHDAFIPIRRLGGTTGWYYGNALWRLRGFIDLLIGGVGLKRGRLHPDSLHVGDYLDFWRVEAIEPDAFLRLFSEMKLPGRAWLEFEVEPTSHGSLIRQTAIFDPVGLSGLLYWYLLYPIHYFIFRGMIAGIAKAAEQGSLTFIRSKRAHDGK